MFKIPDISRWVIDVWYPKSRAMSAYGMGDLDTNVGFENVHQRKASVSSRSDAAAMCRTGPPFSGGW